MTTIDDFNFSEKKALIRVDFNVPLSDNLEIQDDSRIKAAIPTIKKIIADGGAVILMSHLGRPKNGPENKFSLKHIAKRVSELTSAPVDFANDCIGKEVEEKAGNLQKGGILLLENLRFHKEEKGGDPGFAEKLSRLGDIYVNDAFGTAHREHASTAVIAQFFPEKKCFGYVIANELKSVEKVLNNADHPYTAIIGGAKVSSKISIITQLLDKIDNLIIGGGMAYTFIKAKGGETGDSLVEGDFVATAKEVLKQAREKGVEIYLPSDTVISKEFSNATDTQSAHIMEIPAGWMGLDIGPESIKMFSKVIAGSKTILWNGPMGVFEMSNFQRGTRGIAEAVAKATKENSAFSLVGGGDSVAAINKYELAGQVSYVSTGGGALLEYLEGKALPGITAVMN